MTSTEGVALQVDDVYVPLGLVERKKQPKPQGDISPEQGSELYKETEITKTFEHDAFLEEVLKQQNTPKSKGKRIAIIGEPGAGKTTLLQQIADWVSREIPQSIVIWVSLADLRGQELKSYLLESWLTQVAEKRGKAEATEQLKDDFVALFNQNNVWLLLDGLDEMSASSGNPLTEIARQFRETWLISQARIVLTCRVNLWDGDVNALYDFDTYRTLDFSYPEQVEKFIHKWFATIPETGKQLCTALKEPGKERIQDLVKNPLRLTLLCCNWQSGDGKLPDTQAGLYQQFVDDFYKWKKEEFALNSHQRQQLNIKLGELAKKAIDTEATRFRLRQDFVSEFLGDAEDENTLFKLSLNRGWLNCVGVDTNRKPVYAFFHASFQEYFAATAIDDWHFFLNHVPKNPSQGTYRIFEPQWKQTILLWLGRKDIENEKKEEFIEALLKFKDGCKNFYHNRTFLLAASAIAEFKNCTFADEIVARILQAAFGYFDHEDEKHKNLPYLLKASCKAAFLETDRSKVVNPMLNLLKSQWAWYYHDDIAKILSQISPGNLEAISALSDLLNSEVPRELFDEYLRLYDGNYSTIDFLESAAYSLLLLDPNNQHAKAIVDACKSPTITAIQDRYYAHKLGFFPRETGIHNFLPTEYYNNTEAMAHQVIPILINLMNENNNDKIRFEAADELLYLKCGNPQVITTLVEILKNSQYEKIRIEAADKLLQKIAPDNPNIINSVIESLFELLDNSQDKRICLNAADKLLQKIALDNPNVINRVIVSLSELLHTSQDDKIRLEAAEKLYQIDDSNKDAVTVLIELIYTSQDVNICDSASRILKKIRLNNLLSLVVKSLKDYVNYLNCYEVIWHCAQNMPYPDFYQAWHQHNVVTLTMRSLKKILFTRMI